MKALRLFEENEIPDIDGDYLEGQELLQYFQLRSGMLRTILLTQYFFCEETIV